MSYVYKLIKKIFKWVMGIIQKQQNNEQSFKNPIELNEEELKFILTKLRMATYKGDEFEMFYNVWVKLTNKLEKNK